MGLLFYDYLFHINKGFIETNCLMCQGQKPIS